MGLDSVQHRVYNFLNVVFRPDVKGPQRLGANALDILAESDTGARGEERLLEIRTEDAKFWAIIDDIDTTGLLSDQYIYLQVYDLGETVERDERRYKKLTASKQKAIEFLKANEATPNK